MKRQIKDKDAARIARTVFTPSNRISHSLRDLINILPPKGLETRLYEMLVFITIRDRNIRGAIEVHK